MKNEIIILIVVVGLFFMMNRKKVINVNSDIVRGTSINLGGNRGGLQL